MHEFLHGPAPPATQVSIFGAYEIDDHNFLTDGGRLEDGGH